MLSDTPTAVATTGLHIDDLSFRYSARGPDILSGLSVSITAKSFVAVVGRSGTGKSTLLNIILGYLRPTTGQVVFDGEQITAPSRSRIPIYQEDALWPWLRVWENIALLHLLRDGRRAARKHKPEVDALLHRVGLDAGLGERFPKELSVGMRKRVEIARAVFARPKILVADEPFNDLDEVTKLTIHDFVIDVWHYGDFSVLFSTHDVREALYLADCILVLQGIAPAKLVSKFPNPFARNRIVSREGERGYYALYDAIVASMRQ